jgi:hypothetical protein
MTFLWIDVHASCLVRPPWYVKNSLSQALYRRYSRRIVNQIVQALMGVLVILSLVYKRHREPQKRPWRIWSVPESYCTIDEIIN